MNTYGSLLFILQENDHIERREELENNLALRNQRESQMIVEYEARISELQEEIDLDDENFALKLINKLKSEVEVNK